MNKIVFGFTDSNIKTIKAELAKFPGAKYDYHVWKRISELIGWDALSAALWWFKYFENK